MPSNENTYPAPGEKSDNEQPASARMGFFARAAGAMSSALALMSSKETTPKESNEISTLGRTACVAGEELYSKLLVLSAEVIPETSMAQSEYKSRIREDDKLRNEWREWWNCHQDAHTWNDVYELSERAQRGRTDVIEGALNNACMAEHWHDEIQRTVSRYGFNMDGLNEYIELLSRGAPRSEWQSLAEKSEQTLTDPEGRSGSGHGEQMTEKGS